MMHSFIGEQHPSVDVHHLDFNPLNNTLDNLIYLHKSEHHRIHGHHHTITPEGVERIKEAKRGNKIWLGRKHSEETKAHLSEVAKGRPAPIKGRKRWTNGQQVKYSNECPGDGYVLGGPKGYKK